MFDVTKRGLASLALAGLIGFSLIGCSGALSAGKAEFVSHPQTQQDRLIGDPYQAGGRSPGAPITVNTRQLTGTHGGGSGPQE